MERSTTNSVTIAALSTLLAFPAWAHHSDAGLDMENVVTFEGTVTAFHWRNPHVYFTVATEGENGESVEWALQMGSTITVSRMGWNRDTLSPGDRVTVHAHQATDGRPYGYLDSVDRMGGLATGETFREPVETVPASSLEGRWLARLSEVPRYPGGFDGFWLAHLTFTEKGQAALDSYDPFSAENPESQCIGRPTPAMIVSSTRYPMEIEFLDGGDVIEIRSQYWDEVRTVYMDGRDHPDSAERFPSGHSTGYWEEDTLMVDTRNFTDHRSPYQIGVPSGGQKRVMERYTLIEGGTRMAVEFVLEDPEYLAEPMTHARELIHVPQLAMTPFDCDPDATNMFRMELEQ
ncbi:MAG: hypothetical protein F4053_00650 [Proteobacteria bacterium]|nr:hypothetical protein [Pseudomonadota bacterium]MYJ94144.1 hypothetical protein [Pseudomonadota bacterium]